MSEEMSDFLAAFGLDESALEDTDNNPENQNESDTDTSSGQNTDTDTTGNQNTENNQENSSGDNNANPDAQSNQENTQQSQTHAVNQAFAQMRVENSNLRKLLGNVANVLGIDPKTPQEQMLQAIQKSVTAAQAKQQNIDPALLERLNVLEDYKANNERQALANKAIIGFQAVKNQFNLSDTELNDFADQLIEAKVNPYTSDIDLVAEYKLRNFDKLIEAAVARGVEQEARRSKNVSNHSTTPGNTTGGGTNDNPEKISSIAEFDKWLAENDTSK